jgi:heat shock protein HslJ
MLLAACSAAAEEPRPSLDGTRWILESMGSHQALPGTKITARFDEGSVGGSSGCNSYGGSYETDRNHLKIRELTSTLMACLDPEGVMDQEAAYLRTLGAADDYEIVDGKLRISGSVGEALVFLPEE